MERGEVGKWRARDKRGGERAKWSGIEDRERKRRGKGLGVREKERGRRGQCEKTERVEKRGSEGGGRGGGRSRAESVRIVALWFRRGSGGERGSFPARNISLILSLVTPLAV